MHIFVSSIGSQGDPHPTSNSFGGIYFSFSFFFSFLFPLLASRLFGFLSFRLLGFLASRLLGFSAFCWFMRLLAFWLWLFASSAFPVPLRQVAFWLLRLRGL